MQPIEALQSDQEKYAADPEVRRYKRISAGRTNAAVTFPDHLTRTECSDEERQQIADVWASCIKPGKDGGLNRESRTIFEADDVSYWSDRFPGWSFWHQDKTDGTVRQFVSGQIVEDL